MLNDIVTYSSISSGLYETQNYEAEGVDVIRRLFTQVRIVLKTFQLLWVRTFVTLVNLGIEITFNPPQTLDNTSLTSRIFLVSANLKLPFPSTSSFLPIVITIK